MKQGNIFAPGSGMRILGVDFTSSPTRRKPITAAWGRLEEVRLQVDAVELLPSLDAFEMLLQVPGPWIGAFDFPFALPRDFSQREKTTTWREYVSSLAGCGRAKFVASVRDFMLARETGNKRPARYVDRLAGSASSLNVVRPAVGKMFFEGASRLLDAGVSIEPCCRNGDSRIALEAYPKLATGSLGVRSYKSDRIGSNEEHRRKRANIIEGFQDGRIHTRYGFDVVLSGELRERLVADESGDQLDAVLCAIQAGWASRQPNFGIPPNADCDEGWIVDPAVLEKDFR
jgi:hypothetical protein